MLARGVLVLALGRYGGLAGLLAHLPVVRALRAPARYIVLVQFALAILAAITVDDLLAIGEGRRRPARRPDRCCGFRPCSAWRRTGAFNARLAAVRPAHGLHASPARPRASRCRRGCTLLIVLAARRVRWALPALVAGHGGRSSARRASGSSTGKPAQSIARLMVAVQPATARPEDTYAAAPDAGTYAKNLLVLRGYRLTTGYAGFFPAVRHPIGGEMSRQLSGTRWTFTPEGVRRPAPGGVERARLIDDRGQQAPGRVQLTADRPGHLAASVRAGGAATLAFTERFHHGWTATAGGRPLEVVRVEYDFLGCRIDAGVEQVELRFAPRSFRHGAIASTIGAVLLAGALLVWRPT